MGSLNLVKEQQYDVKWNAGWTAIAKDSRPFEESSTSPGVCNVGGTQQGCYVTDSKLIDDYTSLSNALSGSIVPPEFALANGTVHRGIAAATRGLTERGTLIATQSSSGTFAESNQWLEQAQSLFKKSITQFQGPNKPANPFG